MAAVDGGFGDWALARQDRLVRTAYLLCGDLATAETTARESLADIAGRWRRLGGDDPDQALRAAVCRRARWVSDTGTAGSALADPWDDDGIWSTAEGADDDRDESAVGVIAALGALTPRQRAGVVLRWYEDRSVADTAAALGARAAVIETESATALERLWQVWPGTGEDDLSRRLEQVTVDVPPADLVGEAQQTARGRTNRRRVRLGAGLGAAALLAGVGTAVLGSHGTERAGSGGTATTASAQLSGQRLRATLTALDGTPMVVGPQPSTFDSLPTLNAGLPGLIGWDRVPVDMTTVVQPRDGYATVDVHVVATMLRPLAGERYAPVLVVRDDRTGAWTNVSVGLTLKRVATGGGQSTRPPLEPRAIDPSGTKVAWVQDDYVQIADVRRGTVHRWPAAGERAPFEGVLVEGGFTSSGNFLVRTEAGAWLVDPNNGKVRRVPAFSHPGSVRFVVEGATDSLVTYDFDGMARAFTNVAVPVDMTWGETWTQDLWAATGALLDQSRVPPTAPRALNALVAATVPDAALRRALVFDEDHEGVTLGGIRAVGFSGNSALFTYSEVPGFTWLLGFDVVNGNVAKVARVLPSVANVGSASQVVSVWTPVG